MRHVLLGVLIVGCGGSKPDGTSSPTTPPPAAGSAAGTPASAADTRVACAAAIGKAATTGRGDEVFSAEDQQLNAEIEATMADGCAATKWPDMVLLCLANGTSRDELRTCMEMLSDAQRQDFMERVLVVTKAHEAAKPPAP